MLIEHAGTLVTLDGAAVTTLLPRLLPLLDGSRTTDELVVALGPAVAPAVENALTLLAENRLLVDGPSPDADGHASAAGAYAAALTRSTTPSAAVAALETARVSVLGSGACAAELARQLATAGVRRVEQLSLDAEPPHGSFVTAVPEPTETDALRRVNERALGCGDPWLQVLPYDGRFVVAGPIFLPGASGCRACFATRRAATSGLRGGLRPGGRGPAAGAVPCPPGLDGRCAGGGAGRSLADDLRPDPPGAVLRARLRHDRPPPVRSAAARPPLRVLRDARPGRAVAVARGDRVTTSLTDGPFTRVDDALPNLEEAVSPLVGIVTQTLSTTSHDGRGVPSELRERARVRPPNARSRDGGLRERRPPRAGPGARRGDRGGARAILGALRPRGASPDDDGRRTRRRCRAPGALRPLPPDAAGRPEVPVRRVRRGDARTVRPGHLARRRKRGVPPGRDRLPRATGDGDTLRSRTRRAAASPARRRSPRRSLPRCSRWWSATPSCSPGSAASRCRSSTGTTTTSSSRTTSGTSGSPGSRSACSTGAASSTCRSRSQSCTDSRRRERRLQSAQGPQPPSPRPG